MTEPAATANSKAARIRVEAFLGFDIFRSCKKGSFRKGVLPGSQGKRASESDLREKLRKTFPSKIRRYCEEVGAQIVVPMAAENTTSNTALNAA